MAIKRKFKDPYIFLAGDFNQWRVEDSMCDFADIWEVHVGPTRNGRCIDRIFTSIS